MPVPLLQTKLYPPPDVNWVRRPGLIQRLDEALRSGVRLSLVSAQAGAGKSTLLSSWAAAQPAAWLSLDADDNEPTRFWTYALTALRRLYPGLAAGLWQDLTAASAAPSAEALRALLSGLLNEIAALPDRVALILDDYHTINHTDIHDTVTFVIDHLPPTLQIVIATRADPPLPLGRWRVRGQLLELRAADLRFTPDEAAVFLNERMGLNLTRDDVVALEARTEGWIAGLQLAALSMQGRRDTHEFVQAFTGSHRFVLDYLVEEVLNRQPPDIQTFLLHTSILDRLCGPLCDAVADRAGSQAVLDQLQRSNLFLIALDDDRFWARYHHLFADLLRARLQQLQPTSVPQLHRRAAAWLEQQGYVVEAMPHALAAGDLELAADLIERHMVALMTRGEMSTLLRWLKLLPETVTRRRPWLLAAEGWIYTFAGSVELVEPLAKQAEQLLREQTPDDAGPRSIASVAGNLAAMRAFVAQIMGDDERAIELARDADRLLPPDEHVARSVIPYTLGRGYRMQGEMFISTGYFETLLQVGKSAGIWTMAAAYHELAISYKLRGELRRAHTLYLEALQQLDAHHARRMGAAAKIDIGLGDLLREWNELDRARPLIAEAVERMRPWSNPLDLVVGYTHLVRVLESAGDFDEAWAAWREGDRVRRAFAMMPFLSINLDLWGVRLWLATGRLVEAQQWVEAWLKTAGGEYALLTRELEAIQAARVLLALDRSAEAIEVLSPYLDDAARQQRHGRLLQMLALLAIAQQQLGRTPEALTTLARALTLAEPEDYVRLFVDEGEPVRRLLIEVRAQIDGRAASSEQRARLLPYIDRVLAAFKTAAPAAAASNQSLIEPLSERELEVLRLLAQGLSNAQIADRLVVAVGTIKTHIHNIYGKLGAQNRAQAVTRANELHLLK